MSPTVFRYQGYRGFFFSREEARPHVHVSCAEGEAKFWLEPVVAAADRSRSIPETTLTEMQRIVEERRDDIIAAWNRHFRGG
ncbi:MAG: DUF4160 domain-containing protein [Deltaproteobacteria bacterium]|nr:DUF4160 domain-containing protein [Deltaproteobacteria bacterium]